MMMPANFSAVSENEMTYVMGGSIVDYLCPKMEAKDWQKFSTNMVTIIGNAYLGNFVANTLGKVFTGTYVPGDVLGSFADNITGVWGKNYTDAIAKGTDTGAKITAGVKGALNVALYFVGNAAAIYNLGFGTVDNAAKTAGIAKVTF